MSAGEWDEKAGNGAEQLDEYGAVDMALKYVHV